MNNNIGLSNIDFNKLGMEVVSTYLNKETNSLLDGVLAIGSKYNLNSNGIKRLSEKANHFMQINILKYSDDKKKEFTVVDPDEAVRLHAENTTRNLINKEASLIVNKKYEEGIPNFTAMENNKKHNTPFEKQGSIYNTNKMREYKDLLYKRAAIKDKINSIMLEKMASTLAMNDILEEVYNMYSHAYAPSFTKVAYDIYNKYGEESYPFIKNMSINLKTPIGDSFVKEAEDNAPLILDDTTPIMIKVSSFIDAQRLYFSSDVAVQKYNDELSSIEHSIKVLGGMA